jgi:hypothetical protein
VPNLLDDTHDGPLQLADAWLQQNIAPLISSPTFQADGLLITGYQSTNLYQHQSTLRLILHGLGISSYPAAASTAPEMGEFF